MGDKLGQIKVTVIKGRRLVIRDFKTSDPYVILKLGNQTAKTKVINSCLNPVWNEEFCFTISEPAEVLKLEVFDKDHFKADDEMGTAHLSLQPLVAAARLRTILGVASEGTTLRKVIPNKDNCLAIDSSISWVNGEVVQDVWLRLCDVEWRHRVEDQIERSFLRCSSLHVEWLSVTSMQVSFELYTSCCRRKKTSSRRSAYV